MCLNKRLKVITKITTLKSPEMHFEEGRGGEEYSKKKKNQIAHQFDKVGWRHGRLNSDNRFRTGRFSN